MKKQTPTVYDFSFRLEHKGEYFMQTKKAVINPANHDSIQEILTTIEHEGIHAVLDFINEDSSEFDEHWFISHVVWNEYYF